jgi:hypothetical protein
MENISLRQQLEAFDKDIILDSSGNENECFNFYDWFCKDKALKAKAEKLFKQTKLFVKKFNIDIDKHYVFFKNNCPVNGPLYDDFRICDIETGDVIYNVTAKSGHSGQAEIWGRENGFKEKLFIDKNLGKIYKSKQNG